MSFQLDKENVKYVLVHPNGKTIHQIIQDKLNEKNEEASKGDVQGGTIEGTYDYNKCHFAEIIFDPAVKGYETLEQDIIILNAESPSQIFVCPSNQIGLAEDLVDQIRAYVAAVGDNFLGAAPIPNHLCIAKSAEIQAAKAEEMATAQHKLNVLAAITFPVMAVATLFG